MPQMQIALLGQTEKGEEGSKEMNPITVIIVLLAICVVLSSVCLGLVLYLFIHIRKTGVKK